MADFALFRMKGAVRRLFALVGACVMAVFFVARSGQRSGGCGPSEFQLPV
jgi:hypothetical protein